MAETARERLRLTVADIACERGGRLLFSGLGFSLGAGEALLLKGPNGAGKTSLLMIIAGLLRPLEGEARLAAEGGDERELPEEAHLVGHRDGLKSQLSACENLSFWRAMLGAPGLTPEAGLAALGLPHVPHLPCAFLSAGQRRRVALARLLVSRRPLWLLDEPTAALDAASRGLLAELMRGHLASGGLIVAATHEPIGIAAAEIEVGR